MPNSKNSQPRQAETKKRCKDCATGLGVVQCRCNSQCMLCQNCAEHTRTRAIKNDWYTKYVYWCDTCIWFDIG